MPRASLGQALNGKGDRGESDASVVTVPAE
jgi:hypothetical protein